MLKHDVKKNLLWFFSTSTKSATKLFENERIVTLKCQYCRAEGKIFQDKNDESLRMTGLKKREINFVLKFYDLNDNEEFINGQTDLCKKCKENISIYGMPKNCQTCDIQAAFTEGNCEKCDF